MLAPGPSAHAPGVEQFQELARREHRWVRVDEVEQVAIARDEIAGRGGAGECDQVVVVRIRRNAPELGCVLDEDDRAGEAIDERARESGADPATESWPFEYLAQLVDQRRLARSSKRPSPQAATIWRGGPSAEMAA